SYYAKGEVGLAMPKKVDGDKLKKSVIFGIEGGYKMNENFRFGLGIGMLNNVKPKDVPAGTTAPKASSLFGEVNAYYDIGEFNGFTPYLTAGVGVSRNKLKNNVSSSSGGGTATLSSTTPAGKKTGAGKIVTVGSDSKTKTNFAWNVGLGAMYNIDPEFAVDLTYRYRDLGKVMKGDNDKLKSHNVTVGLVYKF
ncbi:hypothetical protein TRIADDRAFT_62899, partial [Trichoplax adhaerens]